MLSKGLRLRFLLHQNSPVRLVWNGTKRESSTKIGNRFQCTRGLNTGFESLAWQPVETFSCLGQFGQISRQMCWPSALVKRTGRWAIIWNDRVKPDITFRLPVGNECQLVKWGSYHWGDWTSFEWKLFCCVARGEKLEVLFEASLKVPYFKLWAKQKPAYRQPVPGCQFVGTGRSNTRGVAKKWERKRTSGVLECLQAVHRVPATPVFVCSWYLPQFLLPRTTESQNRLVCRPLKTAFEQPVPDREEPEEMRGFTTAGNYSRQIKINCNFQKKMYQPRWGWEVELFF